MANESNDSIDHLIARTLAGEATPEELSQLEAWRREPANEARFESARRAFDLAAQHLREGKTLPLVDVDAEWQKFLARVQPREKEQAPGVRMFSWARVAAAIFIVAAAALAINYFTSGPEEVRYATTNGTQHVTLPDGSTVTMNRHSTLSYHSDYQEQSRTVTLTGEAFFDVKPDRDKPFIITSGNATVEVVGTSFNVNAYEQEAQLVVTVETGVVRLASTETKQAIELRPGDAGMLTRAGGKLVMETNRDVNYRSWSTRHLEFRESTLLDVVKTLNKTYGAHITIAGTVSPDCVVTVTFDNQSLDAVLRVLETTLHLTYRVDGDSIEITGAQC